MTKPLISIIVAMSSNRVIGRDGGMPWHLPGDLKYFKSVTMGKPIIMGRKTFESIGKALPGRLNIVISRTEQYWPQGITGVDSLETALTVASATSPEEIMIIGGGSIYREALPLADQIYLTEIAAVIEGDTYFPELNTAEWAEISSQTVPAGECPYALKFQVFERQS